MIFPEAPKSKREVVMEQIFAPFGEDGIWMKERLVLLTALEPDKDGLQRVRGVCIPPMSRFFGLNLDSFAMMSIDTPIKAQIYSLQYFLRQPAFSAVPVREVLFAPEERHIYVSSIGSEIIRLRDDLLRDPYPYEMAEKLAIDFTMTMMRRDL